MLGVELVEGTGLLSVTLRVTDAAGLPVSHLEDEFEFTVAKLVVGQSGNPDYWQSYINRSRLQSGGVNVLRAASERGQATAGLNGVYTYTFSTDLETVSAFQYYGSGNEPAPGSQVGIGDNGVLSSAAATAVLAGLDLNFDRQAVHRIAIWSRARSSEYRFNATVDFIPAELPELLSSPVHQAVSNASCGSCHGTSVARDELHLPNVHGNVRYDVNLCVTCHNANTYDSRSSSDSAWTTVDLGTMVHKLHSAEEGYSVAGRDYSALTYPQNQAGVGGVLNCRSCHDNQHPLVLPAQPADRSLEDAHRWKSKPSIQACGSCHTEIDFSEPHAGAVRTNAQCGGCHPGDAPGLRPIETAHATQFSTPNNPLLSEGSRVLTYEIDQVTENELHQPIVRFRILIDGEPLDLKNPPAGITFGANPNFKIVWAAPQRTPLDPYDGPGFDAPGDWNNLTITDDGTISIGRQYFVLTVAQGLRSFDQPPTVTFGAALPGLSDMDSEGYFTTAPGIHPTAPVAYPSVSTMRGVAIEGAFAIAGAGNITGESPLVQVQGPGLEQRRQIVAIERCTTCHERIRFHGGGRDNNPQYCVTCHNPEMTNSGRGTVNGITYGELSNNFKDMIHAIHAGKPVGGEAMRTVPFRFIRGTSAGGSGQGIHDLSHIGYPSKLGDCRGCHLESTYSTEVPDNALWSTVEAFESAITESAPHNEHLKMRNPPLWTACGACHDTALAAAHFNANVAITRGGSHVETCGICHGPGRTADVDLVHGLR